MELPDALRRAVEAAVRGADGETLSRAAAGLSVRYRNEVRDGRLHVGDDLSARAYAAVRLPATYAAIRAALEVVGAAAADFAPKTALDVGAGPGTAVWAAAQRWPSLAEADLVEASPAFRALGEALAAESPPVRMRWRSADACGGLADASGADLVMLAYVLNELPEGARSGLVARLWELTHSVLVILEPGTPAGWSRILRARDHLIGLGARVLAPCPHALACPLRAPDWCHFSRRVARSRLHRLAKEADVPWEDERYAYIAVGRGSGNPAGARVIAEPRTSSGQAWLKLCRRDGQAVERHFARRDGDAYKAARRAKWGDPFAQG